MSTNVFNKYPPQFDFGGRQVLNAGCGYSKYFHNNIVNLDAFDICKPDVVHDLNKTPLPFKDETFDLVIANHIMEHLTNWWDCFNEFSRITKPNGKVEIWVPSTGSDAANGFRDHVVEINPCAFYGTFGTYRNGGNAWAIENGKTPANRLKLVNSRTHVINNWWVKYAPDSLKAFYAKHLRNIAIEDGYIFRKVTVQEHDKEMEKFYERKKECEALSVPSLR